MLAMGLRILRRGITRRFRRSAIVFSGIAFAVASMVTLEAIMQGVTDAMIRNSVAVHHGHLNATWREGASADVAATQLAQALPEVEVVLPRRRLVGTLVHQSRQVPMRLYGVDAAAESTRTVISAKITEGVYLAERGTILLGASVAESLGVSVGQTVELWRKGHAEIRYRVAGLYRTGIDQFDQQLCFANWDDVPSSEWELAVFLSPGSDVAKARRLASGVLPAGAVVRTWQEALGELVQLTDLNRMAMNVVLVLVLLILAFGVANTAYISVNDRIHEFGILKAMGVTPRGIMLLVQGEIVLVVGLAAVAGIVLGAGISTLWGQWGLDLSRWTSSNRHFISSSVIYPRMVVRSLVLPMSVAVVCSLLAASLPARRAGRVSVVEALKQI